MEVIEEGHQQRAYKKAVLVYAQLGKIGPILATEVEWDRYRLPSLRGIRRVRYREQQRVRMLWGFRGGREPPLARRVIENLRIIGKVDIGDARGPPEVVERGLLQRRPGFVVDVIDAVDEFHELARADGALAVRWDEPGCRNVRSRKVGTNRDNRGSIRCRGQ